MSHTYEDETGIIFHYNSDLSGGITIVVPPNNPHGDGTEISIEADVLSRFVFHAMMDPEETLAWLDKVREWITHHTNVVAGPTRVPVCSGPNGTVFAEEYQFKFKLGDKVFLTFKEAEGDTGEVIDVGFQVRSWDGGRYEYANVRLDRDGTETGPMPVTCICHRRDMPY